MSKRKPAADAMIRLGDLFDDLPDDIKSASEFILRRLTDRNQFSETAQFELATRIINHAYLDLLKDELANNRDPGGGPIGPRLPAGVTFAELLPHLSAARNARKVTGLDAWCQAHTWPSGMSVVPSTLRGWLIRYTELIDKFEVYERLVVLAQNQ